MRLAAQLNRRPFGVVFGVILGAWFVGVSIGGGRHPGAAAGVWRIA